MHLKQYRAWHRVKAQECPVGQARVVVACTGERHDLRFTRSQEVRTLPLAYSHYRPNNNLALWDRASSTVQCRANEGLV